MANNADFVEPALYELAHQNLHCLQNQAMSPPAWERVKRTQGYRCQETNYLHKGRKFFSFTVDTDIDIEILFFTRNTSKHKYTRFYFDKNVIKKQNTSVFHSMQEYYKLA